MISINNVTVAFGGFTLLNDVNFHITDNDRIGLVGKNGAGKSTLLKLILGQNTPTEGKIMVPPGLTLGYLPQQMEHAKDKTVIDEALTAFNELFELHARIEQTNSELANRTDYDSPQYNNLIVRLNEYNDRVAILESEPVRSQAEKVLIGLGFKRGDLERPTSTFSQGWNMRIELAKLLLKDPDVLLLDEPTIGVDPVSRQELWDIVYNVAGPEMTVILSTSYMDEAERCAKVHVLQDGKLLASGQPQSVMENLHVTNFAELFLKHE